ncbi:Hypothetical predicted protein, partial [Paramuricea clavata]
VLKQQHNQNLMQSLNLGFFVRVLEWINSCQDRPISFPTSALFAGSRNTIEIDIR